MRKNDLLEPESTALDLPEIDAREGSLPILAEQAWHAVEKANQPPRWFTYGGAPTRLVTDSDSMVSLQVLDIDKTRHLLARVARWIYLVKKDKEFIKIDVAPPTLLVKDLLAHPNPPLPVLMRVTRVPTFAPDGSLRTEVGYDAIGRGYYWPTPGFSIPSVPSQPSRSEVDDAVRFVREELLPDFPFVGDADRCHAMAILFQPFVRDLIVGPTPLHVIEKPSPGTGAGLLTEVLVHPALGSPAPMMTEGRNEEEWRKRLTAKLMTSPSVLVIDNLRRRLDSAALSSILTATIWEDRVLGFSRIATIPVRCTWIATGNNPTFSEEISRRVVRVRLDARIDRPWLRTGFRHPLPAWAYEHRTEIVVAILTIVSGWMAAGRPSTSEKRLGMFEDWSHVMGGVMEYAGIGGFLGNLQASYDTADAEGATWRRLTEVWWETHGGHDVGVAELYPIVIATDSFDLGSGNEKSQRTKLGLMLGNARDRQFGRLRILAAPVVKGAQRWRLVNVESGSPDVHPNVHQEEAQSQEGVAPRDQPSGERGERSDDASPRARAQGREEGPENVHQVHHVLPQPDPDIDEVIL